MIGLGGGPALGALARRRVESHGALSPNCIVFWPPLIHSQILPITFRGEARTESIRRTIRYPSSLSSVMTRIVPGGSSVGCGCNGANAPYTPRKTMGIVSELEGILAVSPTAPAARPPLASGRSALASRAVADRGPTPLRLTTLVRAALVCPVLVRAALVCPVLVRAALVCDQRQ